jgi:DNA processing protein
MRPLSSAERLDWLQLIRTPTIGPVTFHRLIARFKTADQALTALPDLAKKAGRNNIVRAADRREAENELHIAEQHGVRIITAAEPDYPPALRALADCPPVIYVRGHTALFEKPAVAIIGARNASGVGLKLARTFAADLGAAGIVVASGLARGIDGAAHVASLETGAIAVVAGGVDVIYPPEHEELTARLANEGAIISERPMGHNPVARDFPRRNRLISGVSRGVVIIEAADRSGTLHTAKYAGEQGREVFVVPGSPLDPRYGGSNNLLRDGAVLVRNAEDVIVELATQNRGVKEGKDNLFDWADADTSEPDRDLVKAAREKLLELLSFTPLHRDEILREADFSAGVIADALLDLVLTGEAMEHDGGRFSLAPPD